MKKSKLNINLFLLTADERKIQVVIIGNNETFFLNWK